MPHTVRLLRRALYLLCLGLASIASEAAAAPLTVHAAVLGGPNDHVEGSTEILSRLLEGSGSYTVVDGAWVELRLGKTQAELWGRCRADAGCWASEGASAGLDQVVLIERIDEDAIGVRVVDVVDGAGFRTDKAKATYDGRGEAGIVDRLFFGPGRIQVLDAPAGATVMLDGGYTFRVGQGPLEFELAAGKHAVEVGAEGYLSRFAMVVVVPAQVAEVSGALLATPKRRSRLGRWTTYYAVALVAGGAAGVWAVGQAPSHAAAP